MNRVPRGFNDLVARKAREAAEIVRLSVVPIFKTDFEFKPAFEGTGVLVRVEGMEVLVSAAHVFDEMKDGGVHLLLEGREKHALSDAMRVTLGPRPRERLSDTIDVGFVRLTQIEADAAGRGHFIELQPRVIPSGLRWHLRYVVLGYQAGLQVRNDDESKYNLEQTYYSARELPRGKYRLAGVEEAANIALDFNRRSIAGPRGRGGKPNFAGMSGGGIWEIDPYETYSIATPPRLVGFLAGPAPKNKKALFGANTTALQELFYTMKDELDSGARGG